ncbi:AT-rich interactive domain-containing protein 5 [Linum perenne]
MQGWHSRLLGNDEVCQPVIKVCGNNEVSTSRAAIAFLGLLKRKKPSSAERTVHVSPLKSMRADTVIVDVGPPAEWVKINVQRTNDCYEVYALVPGLLREEVRVQSDPAGRLIITGQPEQLENPWGVTPFKKVVSLPSRIDSLQTSAVVTLHGQLFIRVPFEQSDV